MLRTTDRELREELRRKDEQLELTVEMLRRVEHEIAARNSELAEARRELARLRGEGGAEAAPLTLAALMAAPPDDDDDDDGLDGHLAVLAAAQEALDGTVAVAPPSPDAAAAAAYPYGRSRSFRRWRPTCARPTASGPRSRRTRSSSRGRTRSRACGQRRSSATRARSSIIAGEGGEPAASVLEVERGDGHVVIR